MQWLKLFRDKSKTSESSSSTTFCNNYSYKFQVTGPLRRVTPHFATLSRDGVERPAARKIYYCNISFRSPKFAAVFNHLAKTDHSFTIWRMSPFGIEITTDSRCEIVHVGKGGDTVDKQKRWAKAQFVPYLGPGLKDITCRHHTTTH